MTDVVQPVAATPAPGEAPGWRAQSADGLEISYWDGTRYTAHRVWDGTEWRERPEPVAVSYGPLSAFPQVAPVHGALHEPQSGARRANGATPQAATRWQATPQPRRRRKGLVAVVVVVLLAAAGAGAGVVVLKRSANGLSGKSAAEVLATSIGAARAQGSVHLAAVESNGASAIGSYDISATVGAQTVSGGAQGNATLLVMPGMAYLKGDAAFLHNSLGLGVSAAGKYAGQWISFKPGDPGYAQVVSGDTLSSALSEASPTGTLGLTPSLTVDGQQVVGVTGGLPTDATRSGAVGSVTLYVSTAAPYLPVEVVTNGTLAGQRGTSTVTFSHWGEPVSVTAPAGATPFSSLAQALAPSPIPG